MNNEWYYSENGKQKGPVEQQFLEQLFESKQLSGKTLVWQNGMTDWKPLVEIVGISKEQLQSPLQDVMTEENKLKELGLFERAKQGVAAIAEKAQSATQSALLQAEKTKIIQISLPSAFHRLGKDVYSAQRFPQELADLHAAIRGHLNNIANLKQDTPVSSTNTITDKAKTLAKQAQNAATQQIILRQLDSAYQKLGFAAFERFGTNAGGLELIEPITKLNARIAQIDDNCKEIALTQELRSSNKDIKHNLTSKSIKNLFYHPVIVAFLTLLCFPIGLVLLWKSDSISKKAKMICFGCFLLLIVVGQIHRSYTTRVIKTQLAMANQLWSNDHQLEAIDKYHAILDQYWRELKQDDEVSTVRRVVEFNLSKGNESAARNLVERIHKDNIDITYEDQDAQRFHHFVVTELEDSKIRENAIAHNDSKTSAQSSPTPSSAGSLDSDIQAGFEEGKEMATRFVRGNATDTLIQQYNTFRQQKQILMQSVGLDHPGTKRFIGVCAGMQQVAKEAGIILPP